DRNVGLARFILPAALVLLLLGVAGVASAAEIAVTLAGDQVVPPVTTTAKGTGTISIGDDRAVSGSIQTTGITGTAAHIHLAAPGQNGPVAVPLAKTAEGAWSVAAGAKLTEAQFEAYKAGNLYVNVHSAANPGGEIRGQLKP
ncbi:MAG TPA: CHRD domain-containing protein, partial [Kineosporiaceae bacterium]|nr:CHRD domain-containing protein [Kineosporiaceae bacterium]